MGGHTRGHGRLLGWGGAIRNAEVWPGIAFVGWRTRGRSAADRSHVCGDRAGGHTLTSSVTVQSGIREFSPITCYVVYVKERVPVLLVYELHVVISLSWLPG